ncbi:MAG: chorismate synthase [Phycisphaerae bacterium]
MPHLTYHTAGESHGPAVIAVVQGLPAGLAVDPARIDSELRRRQGGFGRGGRQKIERDQIRILSGLLRGVTIGSPVTLQLENRDHRIDEAPAVTRPRPGHADFAGAVKWLTTDARPVLERASARETAARVAAGALVRILLDEFGIDVVGFVTRIGSVAIEVAESLSPAEIRSARDSSDVYCPDAAASQAMINAIRGAKGDKDTLGGVVEVRVHGCPPGLGSCMRWQDKLDGRLMRAIGTIQAIKAVAIGLGFESAERPGSAVHDPMDFDRSARDRPSLGFVRRTNNAGGIEGGMTNGMPVIVRAAMKPISTVLRGIDSVDLSSLEPSKSAYERSDICAVPAAGVVAENVVAFEIAGAFLEKFAGDTMTEVRAAYDHFLDAARRLGPA